MYLCEGSIVWWTLKPNRGTSLSTEPCIVVHAPCSVKDRTPLTEYARRLIGDFLQLFRYYVCFRVADIELIYLD